MCYKKLQEKFKYFKYLIPLIIIAALALPKPASAFIGTGIFDVFSAMFEGVEEFTAPICRFMVSLVFMYIGGLGALFLSSSFLQTAIDNPQWLNLSGNVMVQAGWSFVAGLTNMFFIMAFVFIALATILKIETYEAKKLLPKLILTAILVNFSLVFVGMIVDVSNIFYKTITAGSTNLTNEVFGTLAGSGQEILNNIIGQILTLIVAFIIPMAGPFFQLALVIAMMATGFVGTIFLWFVECMIFFMMSGMLFTLAFTFIARNFVIQMLAMVAPAAFLCAVMPGTKKYWDEWLKMLIEWNVFGVVTLLFLVIGLRGAKSIVPNEITSGIVPTLLQDTGPVLGWINIPGALGYYVFLFIYMAVTLQFSKKYSPEMAKAIIDQAKSTGRMVYARGVKLGGRMQHNMKGALQAASKGRGTQARGAIAGRMGKGLSRMGLKRTGARLQRYAAKTTQEYEKGMELPSDIKGMGDGDLVNYTKEISGTNKHREFLALTSELAGRGKLDKAMKDEEFKKKVIENTERYEGKGAYAKQYEAVQKVLPNQIGGVAALRAGALSDQEKEDTENDLKDQTNENENIIEKEGINLDEEIRAKYNMQDDEEISDERRKAFKENLAAQVMSIKKFKPEDVEKMESSAFDSTAVRIASRSWKPQHIIKAREKLDDEKWGKFFNKEGGINSEKYNSEEFYKENAYLHRSFSTNPALNTLGYQGTMTDKKERGDFEKRMEGSEPIKKELREDKKKIDELETKRLAIGLTESEEKEKTNLEYKIAQKQEAFEGIKEKEQNTTKGKIKSLLGKNDKEIDELINKRTEEILKKKEKEFERLADFHAYDVSKPSGKKFMRILAQDDAEKELIEGKEEKMEGGKPPLIKINPLWPKSLQKKVGKIIKEKEEIEKNQNSFKLVKKSTEDVKKDLGSLEGVFEKEKKKVETDGIKIDEKYIKKTEESINKFKDLLKKRGEQIKSIKGSIKKDTSSLFQGIKETVEEIEKWKITKGIEIEEKEKLNREKKELEMKLKEINEELKNSIKDLK